MLFRVALAFATMVAAVIAQGSIAFTSTPTSVQVGQSYTITWSGGDSSPVTITLRAGNPGDLSVVGTITTSGTGGSYTWTPDSTIPDGSDYALEISQGTDINYSGEFAISGGTAASAASSANSVISSAVSAQSSLASVASSLAATTSSASTAASSSKSSSSASASSSSSASSASKTESSSTSSASHAATNAAAGFSANQAALALGAVAAALL